MDHFGDISPTPWGEADGNAASGSSIAKTEAFASSSLCGLTDGQHQNGSDHAYGANNCGLPSRPSTSQSSGSSALDALGKDVKQLMDAIQKLRILGFETSVVSLPKIVVIGDQSTGKSSVIEGISGIKVPRNVGTCTRCPLEINLSYSPEPWSCKVYLSRRYMYTRATMAVSSKRPFGPWEPLDTQEETEFAVLDHKDQVAEALTWAQRATLNPTSNYQVYRPGFNANTHHSHQVEFSPNVVRLDISGPEMPNLAFYDLPGLISHVQHESEQYLVKLVENLAREYMKSEETIILLTLTMNHDVQNSKAAGMIQKYKAEDRTLGVFTKPDLMSPEAEPIFVRVFAGLEYKRQLGYFAVKNNPNPDVDHATARAEEKMFFATWSSKHPQLRKYRARFGTEILTGELSKLLAGRIRCSLPKIRKIIDEKIEDYQQQLDSLPRPPTGNLSLDISHNITALGRELEMLLESSNDTSDSKRTAFRFFKDWQIKTRQFRQLLVQSYPRLPLDVDTIGSLATTSRTPSILPSRQTAEVISIDDEDAMEITPAPLPRTPATSTSQRLKRERDEDAMSNIAKRVRLGEEQNEKAKSLAKVLTLERVRDLISSKDDTGLPGALNPAVTKEIFALSINHWSQCTLDYLNLSQRLCGNSIMGCIRRIFAKQAGTQLMREVDEKAKAFIKAKFNDHKTFANRCLKMESTVMTLGSSAIEETKKTAFQEMKEARNRERAAELFEDDESLSDAVRQKKIDAAAKGKTPELTGPDEFEREVVQMATVRGYYCYAANRFAEYVSLSFRSEAFVVLKENLCQHLSSVLRLDQEDANVYIRKLLEVDADVANQRARCEQELVRLRNGLTEILKLENSGSSAMDSWDTASTQSTIL